MDVRIGIIQTARELDVELGEEEIAGGPRDPDRGDSIGEAGRGVRGSPDKRGRKVAVATAQDRLHRDRR